MSDWAAVLTGFAVTAATLVWYARWSRPPITRPPDDGVRGQDRRR